MRFCYICILISTGRPTRFNCDSEEINDTDLSQAHIYHTYNTKNNFKAIRLICIPATSPGSILTSKLLLDWVLKQYADPQYSPTITT